MDRKRLKKVLLWTAAALVLGLFYAWVLIPRGIVIPCMFHLVTGLNCPGCGITRMCMALLRGDVAAAYEFNRALFLALPVLALNGVLSVYDYVYVRKSGWTWKLQTILCWALIVYFLGWGVVRNLYGI